MPRRIAIIGAGVSGLGAAWALSRHPDRFDFRLYEAQDRLGGNAITADMPQDDGSSIPFDISVTALIPSVYQHILLVMEQHDIDLVDTRFSYSVRYRDGVYAHDFDSDIRRELQAEIEKFQKLLKRLHWFGRVNNTRSRLLNLLNPFNYVSMGTVLNWGRYSETSATRYSSPCSSTSSWRRTCSTCPRRCSRATCSSSTSRPRRR